MSGLFVTTGSGASTFERTSRSACATTVVVAVAELFAPFGSLAWDEIVAVLLSVVPSATAASTRTTKVKLAVSLTAIVSLRQVMVPPELNGGVVQFHPPSPVKDCSRVPVGSVSCHWAKTAGPEPLLLTLML